MKIAFFASSSAKRCQNSVLRIARSTAIMLAESFPLRPTRLHGVGEAHHLLDHLVRPRQHRLRDRQAESLGGLEVDDQLVLDRRLHRKVGRLRTLEDEIDIASRAPKIIGQVNSVGQEAAEFSEETVRIDGRKMVASRQRCDLYAMSISEAIRHHDKAT